MGQDARVPGRVRAAIQGWDAAHGMLHILLGDTLVFSSLSL